MSLTNVPYDSTTVFPVPQWRGFVTFTTFYLGIIILETVTDDCTWDTVQQTFAFGAAQDYEWPPHVGV